MTTSNTPVTLTDMAAMTNIKIDASVSFDDLINVYVSRYEETLHTERAAAQASLKQANEDRKTMLATSRAQIKKQLTGLFYPATNGGFNMIFVIEPAETFLDKTKDGEMTTVWPVTITTKINLLGDLQWNTGGYSASKDHSSTEQIQVEVSAIDRKEYQNIDDRIAEHKQRIIDVNGLIQSIDRKTRSIRALVAQRKMTELGMTELLNSTEINDLLQLK